MKIWKIQIFFINLRSNCPTEVIHIALFGNCNCFMNTIIDNDIVPKALQTTQVSFEIMCPIDEPMFSFLLAGM